MFNPSDMKKSCVKCRGTADLFGPPDIIPNTEDFFWKCEECGHNEKPTYEEIKEINGPREFLYGMIGLRSRYDV